MLSPPPLWTFFWLKKGGDLGCSFGLNRNLAKKGGDLTCHCDIWYFAFKPIFTLHPILAKKGGGDLACHFEISPISAKEEGWGT